MRGAGKRQGGCGRQRWGPPKLLPSWPCPHAQVAAEVLEELCEKMGVTDPEEVREFALFLVKGEGEPPCQAAFRTAASLPGPPRGPRARRPPRWRGREPGLPAQAIRCGPCGPTSTSTAWWTRTRACTAGGSAGRPSCTLTTPPTSAPTTARSAPLPARRSDVGSHGRGFRA